MQLDDVLDEPWLDWPSFLDGYQVGTGHKLSEEDYPAILAVNHVYYHARICRWGEWGGEPAQKQHLQFATMMAENYLCLMREACYALRERIDLGKWFPSFGS